MYLTKAADSVLSVDSGNMTITGISDTAADFYSSNTSSTFTIDGDPSSNHQHTENLCRWTWPMKDVFGDKVNVSDTGSLVMLSWLIETTHGSWNGQVDTDSKPNSSSGYATRSICLGGFTDTPATNWDASTYHVLGGLHFNAASNKPQAAARIGDQGDGTPLIYRTNDWDDKHRYMWGTALVGPAYDSASKGGRADAVLLKTLRVHTDGTAYDSGKHNIVDSQTIMGNGFEAEDTGGTKAEYFEFPTGGATGHVLGDLHWTLVAGRRISSSDKDTVYGIRYYTRAVVLDWNPSLIGVGGRR
tara:strand:- start:4228 stop:5130 length:903 start_codon:yes stop_codon:yes gene_type:complete